MTVVDLYCNNDFDVPEMVQTVADAAFPRAEQLLQVIATSGDCSLSVALKEHDIHVHLLCSYLSWTRLANLNLSPFNCIVLYPG